MTGKTGNEDTKNILKYLNNFWRNTEMSLFNCKINLQAFIKYLRITLVFMK